MKSLGLVWVAGLAWAALLGVVVRGDRNNWSEVLQGYDKFVRPKYNTSVTFSGPTLLGISVDDSNNAMEINGWLKFEWQDARLKYNETTESWSSRSYPADLLWLPDIVVFNYKTLEHFSALEATNPIVTSDGSVLWIPPAKISVPCALDVTLWPLDTQECSVTFGSWSQNGFTLDLDIRSEPDLSDYPRATTNWRVLYATTERQVKYYTCCEEPYPSVKMTVKVQRKIPALAYVVLFPAVSLSVLMLVLFLLPPTAGEKITFGGLCIVLNLMYLAFVYCLIRPPANSTPLIVSLANHLLVSSVVSVLVSTMVVRLARGPHPNRLPEILRQPVSSVACGLLIGNYSALMPLDTDDKPSSPPKHEDGTDPNPAPDYLVLAAIIDRILLVVTLGLSIHNLVVLAGVAE